MTSRWWGSNKNGYKTGFPTPGGTLPSCSVAPSISPTGTVGVGTQLTMAPGTWANATSFTYNWTENGVLAQSGSDPTYTSPNNNITVGGSVTANGTVTQAASNTVLIQSADTTAPVLSSPIAADIDYATASAGVTTNEGNGTLYVVVTTSATPPSAAQVVAGQDNLGVAVPTGRSASQGITSTGAKTFGISGLTGGTAAYYAYFCHQDAAGNRSLVAAAASFATPAAPVISAATLTVQKVDTTYGTAAPGVSDPPNFHMGYDGTVGEGDFLQEQIDTVNTFNDGALSGNLRDEELVLYDTGTALDTANPSTSVPQTFDIETGLTPSTTFYVRRRFRRFYGDTSIWSQWSNIVSLSIASLGVSGTWNPADVSNWNAAINLSNSNRTFNDNKSGGTGASRSTCSFTGTDKVFFILNRTFAAAGIVRCGIASLNYGNATDHTIDGAVEAATGYAETAWVQSSNIFVGGSFVVGIGGGAHAGTDPVYVALDLGADKVWFGIKTSGTVTWDGVPGVSGGRSIAAFTSGTVKMLANIQANSVGDGGSVTIETLANAAADAALPAGFTPAGTP